MFKKINLIFLLFFAQDFALAQVIEFPDDLSQLNKSITNFEIRRGETYPGPTAFGSIDGSDIKRLGYIQVYPSFDEPTVLSIEMIYVDSYAQGKGVAYTLLKHSALKQEQYTGSTIQVIKASSYVGGNLDPFLTVLISRLRNKPGYISPDKTLNKHEQFKNCCSKIHDKYPDMIHKALNYVPSVRVGKKLGFEVCQKPIIFEVPEEVNKDINLNFDMCKIQDK